MARKSSALLKNAPVKLPKLSRDFLGTTLNMEIPEGVEEEFRRYYDACVALEEQYVRVDEVAKLVDKKGSSDPNWPGYLEALKKLNQLQSAAFGTCDRLRFTIRHLGDPLLVVEEDVRAVVIDSLSDKLDELQFSVNNGLLGSKIAQAIRTSVIEETMGDPPMCADCQD